MKLAKRILLAALIASFFLFAGCIFDEGPPATNTSMRQNNTVYVNATLGNISANETSQNASAINDSAQNPPALQNASSEINETSGGAVNASGAANISSNTTLQGIENSTAQNSSLQNDTGASAQNPPLQPPAFKITGSASLDSDMGRVSTNRCKISAKSSAIKQGDSTGVAIYAYSPNEEVTFLCGDEERVQGKNGLFQDERICYFNTLGLQSIWLALDGEICATAPVRVYNSLTHYDEVCRVLDETAASKSSGLSKQYLASVYIANYNRNSTISWSCGGEKFERRLYTLLYGDTANGILRLSCNFSID